MKLTKHTAIGSVVVVVCATLVVGIVDRNAPVEEERIPLVPGGGEGPGWLHPVGQHTGTRMIRDVRPALHHSIGAKERLTMPVQIRAGADGEVYVLDWIARAVKRFDAAGNLRAVYGGREGRGPAEFSNVTDFDVGEDRSVWMCDPVNGAVTMFREDGSFEGAFRPERPPHRIALLGHDRLVLMSSPTGEELFTVHDRQGKVLRSFGRLIAEQARLGVALEGKLTPLRTGGFAYAGYRAGLLVISTTTSDSIAVCVLTIQCGGLPAVLTQRTRNAEFTRVDPATPLVTRSVSAAGEDLHLLVGADGWPDRSVIDVYNRQTGEYRYSYSIPAELEVACVAGGHLYGCADSTVSVWELHGESQ